MRGSTFAMVDFNELGYEWLPHAPYSPYLLPSDHFVFPNTKVWLGRVRFGSTDEITTRTKAHFENPNKTYCLQG